MFAVSSFVTAGAAGVTGSTTAVIVIFPVTSGLPPANSPAATVIVNVVTSASKSIPLNANATFACVVSVYVTLSIVVPAGALFSVKFAADNVASANVSSVNVSVTTAASKFVSVIATPGAPAIPAAASTTPALKLIFTTIIHTTSTYDITLFNLSILNISSLFSV